TADRNRSHWSTSKTPSYTKSVSWQHHPIIYRYTYLKDEQLIDEEGHCSPIKDGGFIEGSKSY
ncbi:hypothetical protein L3W61_24840, partial [Escherichia coli]|nr:hypothetical protein [Escherichia coli]